MKAGLAEELQRLSEAAAAAAAAGDEAGSAQAAACPQPSLKQCRAGITEGFKELDRRILERCAAEGWPDGCTAVAVWVLGDTALVANVGDARCVLARRPAPPPGGSGAGAQAAAAVDGGGGAAAEASGGSEGAAGTAEAAVEGGQDAQRSQAGEQGQAAAQQAQQAQQEKAPQQAAQQTAQQAAQHAQQQLEALKAVTLTREHKPVFPAERQRIERAGSFVSADGRLAGKALGHQRPPPQRPVAMARARPLPTLQLHASALLAMTAQCPPTCRFSSPCSCSSRPCGARQSVGAASAHSACPPRPSPPPRPLRRPHRGVPCPLTMTNQGFIQLFSPPCPSCRPH